MSDVCPIRPLAGIVLAGGRGSRMGGAKHLRLFEGRTLLAHALGRLAPQVDTLLLSCNDTVPPAAPGVRAVLADPLPGNAGPLAGVLAGLEYLAAQPGLGEWLLSVPVDTPGFPLDLAARLCAALAGGEAEVALAASPGGTHPVFALWSVRLAPVLRAQLVRADRRSVRDFQQRVACCVVTWERDEAFRNINTEAELAAARRESG